MEPTNEFIPKPLLQVKQVACDFEYLRAKLDEIAGAVYVDDETVVALLAEAYKREMHSRDYNQASSHFNRRLEFDKEIWYSKDIGSETPQEGEIINGT